MVVVSIHTVYFVRKRIHRDEESVEDKEGNCKGSGVSHNRIFHANFIFPITGNLLLH